MKPIILSLILAASVSAVHASDTGAVFDTSKFKGPARGAPNEVLVLGTVHLAQLPKTFDPAALGGLLARLQQWRPQIIAIEASSGPLCDRMRQYPARHKDAFDSYCWDPAPARAATGLNVAQASEQVDQLLGNWPAEPAPAQRRRLAALMLAAGDRVSALVQWLRLPQSQRHADDGLDASLVAILNQPPRNEHYLLSAPLAAALGLERVVSMDDQATHISVKDEDAYAAALMKAWDNPATAQRRKDGAALEQRLATSAEVLSLYRAYNDPAQARLIYASDFGAAIEDGSPLQYGRKYIGYWETRNLRMAANIREAIGAQPGSRALVIVGASHKWYLQHYLNQMHDLRIVDSDAVLR